MRQTTAPPVKGTYRTPVYLPADQPHCRWCRFCIDDPRMRQRRICSETFEILFNIDRRGDRCPVVWEEGGP